MNPSTLARLPMMLTDLRLPTMKQAWQGLATKSNQEGWPAERFLATLLEQEILGREARRLERRRQESNLPPDKRLGNYDFTVVPTLSKAHVQALAEADGWIQEGANLLLFGPPGVGKSHLVAAVGHALVERGCRVYFTRTSDLVQQLQSARKELRLPATLAKLDRFDLLILDDFSYVRRDQAETSVLFELISERYERKSLAITANQPFSAWDQVFPEAAMTVAAVDRLVHRSTILELHAESYRRRTAKNRANVTVTTKEVKRDLEETDSQDGVVSQ
ncbi:MAG: IS21-like element ISAfe9 family helper ATPase IstB [Acidithiobacillus ferrooxidans]|jgi:DNA replication protein DnaC|uniref:IS21-like element helper ATPase IstB n=1 Tax=Acidithiobacillus TaxID=119977 RepID=UPI001C079569|nr:MULTISPECIES: IS21-like element helper ATPase IstB [Acidithiobacillus]MDD5004878.1 IS21-like element ISAfe9 family helper ATPase IstB [Acidithiobacillus sp.]MBU2856231.1 ATP-binding protein [Acidithiobacillus ferrooxidans]MBU2860235.1 ATP-binding protein [Acidithiobacillus ferrooxidans]MDD2748442.1 IS21-like element ISAfe9 family helper ATPase IstB [Acidithiobacillus ferrooxidans]MDD5380007.1 IS21-like element ISAfe9 family helper ATPase IstB [Acidithiobacillus sp.]